MNELIINGVDHAKFDLEWAKRGGIVKTDDNRFIQFTQAGYVGGDWGWFIDLSTKEMKTAILYSELDYDSELDEFHIDRMATQQECADAGVEYIEPPMMWRPIETAPDRTAVLVHVNGINLIVAAYEPDSDEWYDPDLEAGFDISPTHWIPLPPDPKDE